MSCRRYTSSCTTTACMPPPTTARRSALGIDRQYADTMWHSRSNACDDSPATAAGEVQTSSAGCTSATSLALSHGHGWWRRVACTRCHKRAISCSAVVALVVAGSCNRERGGPSPTRRVPDGAGAAAASSGRLAHDLTGGRSHFAIAAGTTRQCAPATARRTVSILVLPRRHSSSRIRHGDAAKTRATCETFTRLCQSKRVRRGSCIPRGPHARKGLATICCCRASPVCA